MGQLASVRTDLPKIYLFGYKPIASMQLAYFNNYMAKKTITKETKEKPITLAIKVDGQDKEIKTDNILESLRSLDIEPTKIKSRATFEVTNNGETYRKILTIIQLKRLLANDVYKQILAKQFNGAVGVTNY